ncbi:hypothetical protein I0C86_25270 [Plantactinospora sp. S1510]|uniref:PknH-like extracellular domain-containing protein n=1 Tax=Plantactinospora alkalitolerans TaxID=2789879 RepID=A0ABS0H1B6_9ACTN|nr:hypothetical protein [Plantactinospora alkalitolerans]MBF9132235.1 hypothetical protein [Plantactinospora alkalitolerans]
MYQPSPPPPSRQSQQSRWSPVGRGTTAAALAGVLAVSGAVPATAAPAAAGSATALSAYAAGGSHTIDLSRRPPTAIPDAALLQPEDLGGGELTPTEGGYWTSLQPPQPCADGPYRSTALRSAERGVQALIGVDGGPEVIMEHVSYYRGNGAHRYLRELRRAVAACPAGDPHAERWTVLATGVAGDESVLLTQRTWVDYAEVYHFTYVLVARVGQALVVLVDVGWEESSGAEAVVREFIPAAVQRAAVLNRR